MASPSGSTPVARRQGGADVNWIIVLVLGALAALLGVFLLFQSTSAARLLFEGIGVYWLIAGLVELVGILSHRRAPGRVFRLLAAGGAVLSGALIVLSMLVDRAVVPGLTRYVVAVTALLMGVLNILVGMDRAAPSRGRQILGVVYALLGIALIINPAVVPSFVLPLIGLLLIGAGGYGVYLAWKGRKVGTVSLNLPSPAASPAAQKQAMIDRAHQDVEQITQQAKESSVGLPKGD